MTRHPDTLLSISHRNHHLEHQFAENKQKQII